MQITHSGSELGSRGIAGAMLSLQKELLIIGHDANVLKKDETIKFKYTTFDKVLSAVRPKMIACGLILSQPLGYDENGNQFITTVINHVDSGECLQERTLVKAANLVGNASEAQEFGAGVTYARRYALLSILGLAAGEEDTDARVLDPEIEKLRELSLRAWKMLVANGHTKLADEGKQFDNEADRLQFFQEALKKKGLTLAESKPVTMEVDVTKQTEATKVHPDQIKMEGME